MDAKFFALHLLLFTRREEFYLTRRSMECESTRGRLQKRFAVRERTVAAYLRPHTHTHHLFLNSEPLPPLHHFFSRDKNPWAVQSCLVINFPSPLSPGLKPPPPPLCLLAGEGHSWDGVVRQGGGKGGGVRKKHAS